MAVDGNTILTNDTYVGQLDVVFEALPLETDVAENLVTCQPKIPSVPFCPAAFDSSSISTAVSVESLVSCDASG